MSDDDSIPTPGRTRGKDVMRVIKCGGRILAAARLAGTKAGVRSWCFVGSPIRRGASFGLLPSSRDRLAGFRRRRAIGYASLVRLAGMGGQADLAHMRYVQRDGVTCD